MLFSTKETNFMILKKGNIFFWISSFTMALIFFVLLKFKANNMAIILRKYVFYVNNKILFLYTVFVIVFLIFQFYLTIRYCTFCDVYSDHIEGIAIKSFRLHEVSLKNEDIQKVTISNFRYINVHTSIGTYKFFTKRNIAVEIFCYYN